MKAFNPNKWSDFYKHNPKRIKEKYTFNPNKWFDFYTNIFSDIGICSAVSIPINGLIFIRLIIFYVSMIKTFNSNKWFDFY
ncbi:hypothetical protein [Methanobrevibacter cuticularis]